MLFRELCELKKWVVVFNQESLCIKADLFNPHMFRDGKWAVVVSFSGLPSLQQTESITSYCLSRGLYAWWAPFGSCIALFVQ